MPDAISLDTHSTDPTANPAVKQYLATLAKSGGDAAATSQAATQAAKEILPLLNAAANVKVSASGAAGTIGQANASGATPTGVPVLDEPDNKQAMEENLEKLLAYLQLATDEQQSTLAQERIGDVKDQLKKRQKDRLNKLKESIEKAKDQENASWWTKALKWITAIFVTAAAAASWILPGPGSVALTVAAGIALASAIMDETGATDAICKALGKALQDKFGCSKATGQMIAQIGIAVLEIGAALACGGAGMASVVGKIGKALQTGAKVAQIAVGVTFGALALGSTAASGVATYTGYKAGQAQADVTEAKEYIQVVKKLLDEEQELADQLVELIQGLTDQTMDILSSSTDAQGQIAQQIGAMA